MYQCKLGSNSNIQNTAENIASLLIGSMANTYRIFTLFRVPQIMYCWVNPSEFTLEVPYVNLTGHLVKYSVEWRGFGHAARALEQYLLLIV